MKNKFLTTLLFVLFSTLGIYAQSGITGTVVDSEGLPLIGVSVQLKGSTLGTITDLEGMFTLQLTADQMAQGEVEFSYVGYKSMTIAAKDKNALLKVEMQTDNQLLEEVVVVGYGTKRKGGVASAVTTVKAEDLSRTTATTTSGALVGKAAGITYRQSSGVPGSATTLQIRNLGTPLYVIDGIIKDEDAFNNLAVTDIDNISILKDGAAAIYGVKAANGVVLVTTKKGQEGKMEVSLNANMGWQQWTRYPELLSAADWVAANYMRDVNSGTLAVTTEQAQDQINKWKEGYYNAETGEDYRGYDWYSNYVRNNAPQYNVNASISGGTEKIKYYTSLSHVGQEAVFDDYSFDRTNLQSNIDVMIAKGLRFSTQISGKIDNTINPGLPGDDDYYARKLSVIAMQPIYRPYANDNTNYINYIAGYDGAHNPASYTIENSGEYHQRNTSFQTNFELQWDTPLKGLSAKAVFSYYYNNMEMNNLEKAWSEYTYDATTKTYNVAYTKTDTWMERQRAVTNDITGQALVWYDNTFNGHHVSATAGFEFYKREYNSLYNVQNPVDNPYIDLMTTSENNSASEVTQTKTTASVVVRAGYDYKQRYIIDFAGRYDGSWKFAKGKRWGFFPSVSAAWRPSEEVWWKDGGINNVWSNFKIRASYGQTGDDNVGSLYPDFAYLEGYSYNNGAYYMSSDPLQSGNSNVIGTVYKGTPNTQISWMTTSLIDVGMDLGFFSNRLTAELDFFRRDRSGIAAEPDDLVFPQESGLSPLAENLNSDMHIGFDGFLKWQDHVGDFHYYVGGNITLARQKNGVRSGEKFYNAWDQYRNAHSNRWSNVESGQVWQWNVIGVFQTQEEIDNYPVIIDGANNTHLQPGDLIFEDVNNDGVIDEYDKRPLSYASITMWSSDAINQPILTFGLNFGCDWKGIDLALDFAGAGMNTYVPDWYMKWACSREFSGYAATTLNSWHHADILDPTSEWVAGDFPPVNSFHTSSRGENNFYTRNVKYIRLRNLVLGYTFPRKWTDKAHISKARLYFEGTNLFCIDNVSDYGIDPEIAFCNGIDYPQSRVYSIGFNLNFK